MALVPAGALGFGLPVHPIGPGNDDYNARPCGSSVPGPLLPQMLKTAASLCSPMEIDMVDRRNYCVQ